MAAVIAFKAKVRQVYNADETPAYRAIAVPVLTRGHCDMSAFRSHPKYCSYANSDLFPGMLARIRRDVLAGSQSLLRLDRLPANVTVDTSGFLAVVTIAL